MTRVLVVDDDSDVRTLVEYSLRDFTVRTAACGEEALRAVAEHQPDVVVLDVMMPGLSGFEVLEQWRGDPATAQLPVILLTAMVREDEVTRGYALGADDYMVKPFNPLQLAQRVRALAQQQAAR